MLSEVVLVVVAEFVVSVANDSSTQSRIRDGGVRSGE